MKPVVVPFGELSEEALYGLVEEFVTRDGTDYGEIEVPCDVKVRQVMEQIKKGRVVIVFDPESDSCNIFNSNDPVVVALKRS